MQLSNNQPSLMTSPQMPTGWQTPSKRPANWYAILISVVAVILAAILMIYSGGIDAIMRLLGVGASEVYSISLTSTYDWLGTGSNYRIIGGAGLLDNTNVFSQFSSVPNDPDPSDKGSGLVTSTFSSSDSTQEIYQPRVYISPVVDLGGNIATPFLSAIEVVDYRSAGTDINYYYRVADTVENISNQSFAPVDLTLESDQANGIEVRTAVIDQTVNKYIQIKFELIGNTFLNRSAVYAFNLLYKPTASPTDMSILPGGEAATERTITVIYEEPNVPTAADIDIISPNLANTLVYSTQGVDLSQGRLSYTFTTNLAPGVYALTISAPQIDTRIVPFLVSQGKEIEINAGSFATSAGVPVNDLNGDGVVNIGDYIILQQRSGL